jgi:hypothetical protein
MLPRTLTAIGVALALSQAPAAAAETSFRAGVDRAVNACMGMNAATPTVLVEAVEDGFGDWLVWLKDKRDGLWMCNASGEGAVYANASVRGDLLAGKGADLIGRGREPTTVRFDPVRTAEAVCAAVGGYVETVQVVGTVEDGMGDYLVWLQNAEEKLWMCNASSDAKLYGFEPVDYPLNDFEPVEIRFA